MNNPLKLTYGIFAQVGWPNIGSGSRRTCRTSSYGLAEMATPSQIIACYLQNNHGLTGWTASYGSRVCVSKPPEEKNFWTHFVSFKEVATIKIIFYMQPCSVTTKVLSFMIREKVRLDEGIIQDRNEGRDGRLQEYFYRQ